jgi:uncharacterized protein YegP (UPF0339 family)
MMAATYPCYWRHKDNGGQYYWVYYASNGEALARSSESYVRKEDCDHCVMRLKQSAGSPYYCTD